MRLITRPRQLIGSAIVLLAVALMPLPIEADHAWGRYHWNGSGTPIQLAVGDNLSLNWGGYLDQAVVDWNASAVLNLQVVTGGSNPATCEPTFGRIEVCNAAYGDNGWLGIAQIWTSRGSHIAQAVTLVNDTYFNLSYYNTPAWRQFVMCQEIGHDFGLDHQDEDFDNTNLGSCMDYTSDPDGTVGGQLSNVSPNAHDYDQLASMYAHLNGGGGGGGGGGKGGGKKNNPPGLTFEPVPDQALEHVPANRPEQWGRLVRSNGRVAMFDLDLGNGDHVFTFVILA